MRELILYYSFTGNSRSLAKKAAAERGADIEEIRTVKPYSTISAYSVGGFRSIRRRSQPIEPLQADLKDYDKFTFYVPVWASNPAPPFNSVIKLLPQGAEVEVFCVSAGGKSNLVELTKILELRGFKLAGCHDIQMK